MRNKKRTTEVEDSSSSSSDSSDDEDEAPKVAPVAEPKATPKKSTVQESKATDKKAPAAGSDDDDSDEDGEGGDADGKRKRKRKRNTKKKATEDTAKPAAASAAPAAPAVTSTAKPMLLSPEQVGPDPNTDLRLSEQAKQAIQYAQIYIKDKSQWKFNKAKQNWLLRNALSVPPSDYDPALARKQSDSAASADGAAEEADEAEEGENFVPEDFVPVVTAYLTSVMGGARQRLIESLKEAVNAPAITIAPTQTEATEEAAKDAATNEEASKGAAEGAATKSVSFGNLALETEKKEEAAEAVGLPAGTDPQSVELRRARATQMLQHMGESL